jgi:Rrf2 family transcriptional regulator, repressor of oqxAB
MIDLRFPTALQVMLSLALAEEERVPQLASSALARSLGANPSFVRRLLLPLARHRLVVSTMGKAGGVRLARPARQITLSEIYAAATAGKTLWSPRQDIPHQCVVTSNIETFFVSLASEAELAVMTVLGKRTLAQALREMRTLDVRKGAKSKPLSRAIRSRQRDSG